MFIIGLQRNQYGKSLSGVTLVDGVLDISHGASRAFCPLFGCSVRATPHVMATRGDCARRTWLCLSSETRKCLDFYSFCNCKNDYQIPTHSSSAYWSLRTDNHDVSRVTSAVRARTPWRRSLPRSCSTVPSSVATALWEAAPSPRWWLRRCHSFSGRLWWRRRRARAAAAARRRRPKRELPRLRCRFRICGRAARAVAGGSVTSAGRHRAPNPPAPIPPPPPA